MKLAVTFSISSVVCLAAYLIAHSLGIPKFEGQGLILVLTGGYLFDALLELLITIVPLLFIWLGRLKPQWKRSA
jgi:hypothetical protein